jgi:hypothetical protein
MPAPSRVSRPPPCPYVVEAYGQNYLNLTFALLTLFED